MQHPSGAGLLVHNAALVPGGRGLEPLLHCAIKLLLRRKTGKGQRADSKAYRSVPCHGVHEESIDFMLLMNEACCTAWMPAPIPPTHPPWAGDA